MPSMPRTPRPPWPQRALPSVLLLVAVVLVAAGSALVLARNVADVLPQVGKDDQGEDPWNDPVAVEKAGPYQVVRIPDCALSPVERIMLWDEDSNPYWEVSGPATAMNAFVIGVTPAGFTVDTPYRKPPAGAVLRLAVVRKVRGVAGVRYRDSDLRTGYVAGGEPISRYQPERFQRGGVCGDDAEEGDGSTATSDTSDLPTADVTTTAGVTTTVPG